MGYTTDFCGKFSLDKELSKAHFDYLTAFSKTRRYKRDAAKTAEREDMLREAVGLAVGVDGEFFVAETGFAGQDKGLDLADYNKPPSTQPGLWCQWEPTSDRKGIEWNGTEKFSFYLEWLEYLVKNFLAPWGYTLSGSVSWMGEDYEDSGVISVVNGLITIDEQELHSESKEVSEFRDAMFLLEELDLDTKECIEHIERVAHVLSTSNVATWLYQPAMLFLAEVTLRNEEEGNQEVARAAQRALKSAMQRPDFVIPPTLLDRLRENSDNPLFKELLE